MSARRSSDRRRYSIDRRAALTIAIELMRVYVYAPDVVHAASIIEEVRGNSWRGNGRRTGIPRRAEDRPADTTNKNIPDNSAPEELSQKLSVDAEAIEIFFGRIGTSVAIGNRVEALAYLNELHSLILTLRANKY